MGSGFLLCAGLATERGVISLLSGFGLTILKVQNKLKKANIQIM